MIALSAEPTILENAFYNLKLVRNFETFAKIPHHPLTALSESDGSDGHSSCSCTSTVHWLPELEQGPGGVHEPAHASHRPLKSILKKRQYTTFCCMETHSNNKYGGDDNNNMNNDAHQRNGSALPQKRSHSAAFAA